MRAERMHQAFSGRKFAPERFEAVDWRALSDEGKNKFYSDQLNQSIYFKPLSAGECGCYASHLAIWQEMVRHEVPWALIMEDDVEPTTDFDRVIESIVKLNMPWDMVKLIGRTNEKALHQYPLFESTRLIRYQRAPSLTGAYMVSLDGAKKLLANRLPFGRPIDIDLRWWWEADLTLYGVAPYPIVSSDMSLDSSIGDRDASSKKLIRKLKKANFNVTYQLKNWWHTLKIKRSRA